MHGRAGARPNKLKVRSRTRLLPAPVLSHGHPHALSGTCKRLDAHGQRHDLAILDDDGFALSDLRAAKALLVELQDVGTETLDIREADIQRLVGRECSEALLVPCGLEAVCVVLRQEVDECVAHGRMSSCALGQVQEVEIGGLVPLGDEHILRACQGDVAHHQCRHATTVSNIVGGCHGVHLKRALRSLEKVPALRRPLVIGAQLLVGTAFQF
mmetsp:Transcript_6024/g.22800  ORF Transcript_6024/g.22800 Transcript_6024/m.22800 type:complete len:213 (-) Transcript_6024:419-1057(-)